MNLKQLEGAKLSLVKIGNFRLPECKLHGAMNKMAVSKKEDIWRCISTYTTEQVCSHCTRESKECKCEAEELLKKPACKKAAEHMKKLYDDQISIAGGVAG